MPLDAIRYLFLSLLLIPVNKQLSSFISILTRKNKFPFESQRNLCMAYNVEPVRISQVEEAFSALESLVASGRARFNFCNLVLDPPQFSADKVLDVLHGSLYWRPDRQSRIRTYHH